MVHSVTRQLVSHRYRSAAALCEPPQKSSREATNGESRLGAQCSTYGSLSRPISRTYAQAHLLKVCPLGGTLPAWGKLWGNHLILGTTLWHTEVPMVNRCNRTAVGSAVEWSWDTWNYIRSECLHVLLTLKHTTTHSFDVMGCKRKPINWW